MISESSRRISACNKPTALLAASSERNELEHTSSARPSVRWAWVIRPGRISWRTTRTPALATCQAASEPASPAPTICTDSEEGLVPVMDTEVARFRAQWNAARGLPADTITPAARRALSVRQSAKKRSAVIGAGGNARNVRAIKADIRQFPIVEPGPFVDIAVALPAPPHK